MSASWNTSLPSSLLDTCPDMAISGMLSAYAVARAVIRFVAPGPDVTTQTAGLRDILA